jgi:hypothetical protein
MDYTTALAVYEAADQSLTRGVVLESTERKKADDFDPREAEKTYSVRLLGSKSLDHDELRTLLSITETHSVRFDIKHGYGVFSS